jgi:two-component system, LytTR family, response regulator
VTAASIHVLVVDDDASARQHIRALLAAHDDVIAEECSDGREAVRALTSAPVDLVLLDVEMPNSTASACWPKWVPSACLR